MKHLQKFDNFEMNEGIVDKHGKNDKITFRGNLSLQDLKSKELNEELNVPLEVGDEILGGRFKNKKIVVKRFGRDDNNQITVNGKPLLKYRISKTMPRKKKKTNESHSESDIIEVMEYLDTKVSEYRSSEDSNFSYILKSDDIIEIDYSWSDYEEGYSETITVKFGDMIELESESGGHSVMVGDYNNEQKMKFDNVEDLIKELNERI